MEPTFLNSSHTEMATDSQTTIVKDYILRKFSTRFNIVPQNLDLNENLLDLGLDSSIIVKIAEEFETELSIKLYPTVFFEYQTLNEIIRYFTEQFGDAILRHTSDNSPGKAGMSNSLSQANDHSLSLRDQITDFLSTRLASVLDIHPQQIDLEQNLLDLGLGSSSLVHLAEELEKDIKITLYPTVFFEYQNLSGIIDYFLMEFSEEFSRFFTTAAAPANQSSPVSISPQQEDVNTTLPFSSNTEQINQAEDLHAYTLSWQKSEDHAGTDIPGSVYITCINDLSHIKKHLLKGVFPKSTVLDLDLSSPDFSSMESGNVCLVLYLNENNTDPTNANAAYGLLHQTYFHIQTALKAITSLDSKRVCQISVIMESAHPVQSPYFFAFRSLLKSINAELPQVRGHVLGISALNADSLDWLKKRIATSIEQFSVKNNEGAFDLITRRENLTNSAQATFKPDSTYIISGGSGKLGRTIARLIASRSGGTIVLLGRRPDLPELESLKEEGRIVYRSCDIKDVQKVNKIIKEVSTTYGPVRGVVHAAGIIEDSPFLTKTEAQLNKVANTKITGLINLDLAVREQPLDFFIGFSSVSSFMGNRSQTDYAIGNGFMDGYLRKRNAEAARAQNRTKYISINWPLWENGGMAPPRIVIEIMSKNFGIQALSDFDGLFAFDRILSGNTSQIAIIKGRKEKFEKLLAPISTTNNQPIAESVIPKAIIHTDNKDKAKDQTLPPSGQSRSDQNTEEKPPVYNSALTDIAIIGIDGNFPLSPDLSTYWKNLVNGTDMVSLTPRERLATWRPVIDYLDAGSEERYTLSGGFIDDMDKFDAEFFNISAREAEVMDPQQRLFLESAWKCVQDAGYDHSSLAGSKTGVFAAVSTRDYHELMILNGIEIEPQLSTGLAHCILPNRVSYWMNFNGPSEAIDTACSSSLVAMHRAVTAIHNGECEQALVGGVNLIISPLAILAFSKTGILGKDGRCKTFDKDANGYVRGEGVGTILLKPLYKAMEDGDHIYGVVKGSSVNHGGRGKSLTAPNPSLQAEVISNAILRSGCDVRSISYIEAHGTGTALGDPVEIDGLKRAFINTAKSQNSSWPSNPSCGIGAVKSNIGHLESAAGIAGVIKVLLALRHKKLPASLHINEVNPFINLNNSPFYLVRETSHWPTPDDTTPRRAGVSSFGFGGTNAHVILEEYRQTTSVDKVEERVFPFSAPSKEQLRAYLHNVVDFLQNIDDHSLSRVAYTLQTGRGAYPWRCVFRASSVSELIPQMRKSLESDQFSQVKNNIYPLNEHARQEKSTDHSPHKKDLDNIAETWLKGAEFDCNTLYHNKIHKIPLPTFPLKRTRFWFNSNKPILAAQTSTASIDYKTDNKASTISTKPDSREMKAFLIDEISLLLKKNIEDIDCTMSFLDYGLDSILGMSLVKKIEQRLNMPIYVNEILQHDTIDKLSVYLEKEGLNKLKSNTIETTGPVQSLNKHDDPKLEKPIVFLLSTPRAGSTLLRAMLMGHSGLFAPPELHLLNFNNLRDRSAMLGGSGLSEGLNETLKTLTGKDTHETKVYLKQLEDRETSQKEIYKIIQNLAGNQILVDKSPGYAANMETLRKAEKQFVKARYIHLIRHPFAVMESIVRNRFHKFIPQSQDANPYKLAENVWHSFNNTISDFLSEIPAEHSITVYYEDLVADPKGVLTKITDFLHLPFEASMLNPYQDDRLIKGLHENSLSVGDPNFLKHSKIEKELASSWQSKRSDMPSLDPATISMANKYGYDVGQALRLSRQQEEFITRSENKKWLLEHHFTFVPNQSRILSEDVVKLAVTELLRTFPVLGRLLDSKNNMLKPAPDYERLTSIYYEDLSHIAGHEKDLIVNRIADTAAARLDIETGPVLFFGVLKNHHAHTGLLIYHHLLGDGMTSAGIIKRLIALLNGIEIKPPSVKDSYIFYLNQLNQNGCSDSVHFHLPATFIIPHEFEKGPNSYQVMAEETKTISILDAPCNMQNIFLKQGAALATAIGKWTASKDVVLDVRYHGRTIPGSPDSFMDAIGFFAYDIPVHIHLDDHPSRSFKEGYARAKSRVRQSSPRPASSVRLNFQPFENHFNENSELELIQTREIFDSSHIRKHLLDCVVRYGGDRLCYIIRYSENHFSRNTIVQFLDTWIEYGKAESISIPTDNHIINS